MTFFRKEAGEIKDISTALGPCHSLEYLDCKSLYDPRK